MIPASFEYLRPASVAEAVRLAAAGDGAACFLAGGHSLLPAMKLRQLTPRLLVDLGDLDELTFIRTDGADLVIGAATTHDTLARSPVVAGGAGLLAEAAGRIGDPQVRNRGTIGGSLAWADPVADLPTALLAWGGVVEILGPLGRRDVPSEAFHLGAGRTALNRGELITAVRVPLRPAARWAYQRFARTAVGPPIVAVAATDERFAVAGVADRAVLTADGIPPDAGPLLSDVHAGEDFRRHLATVLVGRAAAELSLHRPSAEH